MRPLDMREFLFNDDDNLNDNVDDNLGLGLNEDVLNLLIRDGYKAGFYTWTRLIIP